jgi:hypothetical protein
MSGVGQLIGSITRNLAPLFDDQKGAHISKNWLAFVGRGGGTTIYSQDVNECKYEIIRGKRQMAKLVKRSEVTNRLIGKNQTNLGLGEFTEVNRAFPLSIEEYDIQSSKLTERVPGEKAENSGWTKKDRMVYWAAKGQQVLLAKQGNLANLLASQGILSGSQDSILGTTNPDEKYDFYRNATHSKTLAGGLTWKTNPTAALPLTDLDVGCDALKANSGKMPQFALMGGDSIQGFLAADQITDLADNRGFTAFHTLGANGTQCPAEYQFLVDAGWECRGKISTLKGRTLWLFGCEELMADYAGGADAPAMPLTKVVLGNVNSRMDAQFGPSETFDEDTQTLQNYMDWFGFAPGVTPAGEPNLMDGAKLRPEMFYLDAIRNKGRTLTTMRSQFAPLYIPVATDEWYVIENAGV